MDQTLRSKLDSFLGEEVDQITVIEWVNGLSALHRAQLLEYAETTTPDPDATEDRPLVRWAQIVAALLPESERLVMGALCASSPESRFAMLCALSDVDWRFVEPFATPILDAATRAARGRSPDESTVEYMAAELLGTRAPIYQLGPAIANHPGFLSPFFRATLKQAIRDTHGWPIGNPSLDGRLPKFSGQSHSRVRSAPRGGPS